MEKVLRTTQINLYDCKSEILSSTEKMNSFLEKLVVFIGMKKIPKGVTKNENPASFSVHDANFVDPIDFGVTGTIILYESHASAHGWSNLNFCCIVVCSCKEYDADNLVAWILEETNSTVYKMDSIKF